jgi:predicted outer membrane repeat protein
LVKETAMRQTVRTRRAWLALRELESRAAPAVFLVTATADTGPGTLRQALDDANALPGPDTVTFAPAVFSTPQSIFLSTGQLAITDDVAVVGPGSGLLTVANAGPAGRVVHVDRPARVLTVSISGLTLTGGRLTGAGDFGAGLLTTDETLTLTDVTVTGNESASRGGGIAQTGPGLLTLVNCTVAGNRSTSGSGGGIAVTASGRVRLAACTVEGNAAQSHGGGLYFFNGGGLTVERSTISGNTATAGRGGGVYFFGTAGEPLTLTNSTVSGNAAHAEGGGLALRNFTGRLDARFCTITANLADTGGGVWQGGSGFGAVEFTGTILSGNAAKSAIDVSADRPVRFQFSALGQSIGSPVVDAGNNLPAGSALHLGPLADNGGPTKTHALSPGSAAVNEGGWGDGLASDQAGGQRVAGLAADIGAWESPFGSPPIATLSPLADWRQPGPAPATFTVTYAADSAILGSSIGNDDIRVTGPHGFDVPAKLLAIDQPSDGPLRTATYAIHPPGSGWAAANSGRYAISLQAGAVTDVTGTPVPAAALGPLTVRVPGVFVVTTAAETGGLSLRAALALANASPSDADTIRFDPGIFSDGTVIRLTSGELSITDGVVIEGPPAGVIIDAGGKSRLLNIDDGDPTRSIAVTLLNLHLANGVRLGQSASDRGGAVFIRDEDVTLIGCTVSGSYAEFGAGAINLAAGPGRLTLINCDIRNNAAGADGGAVRAGAGTSLEIHRTTFDANRSAGDGGAIFANGAAVTIDGSTLSFNIADGALGGGGVALIGPAGATVQNSTLSGNFAARSGGGIATTAHGTLAVRNATIVGNEARLGVGGGIARISGPAAIAVTSSIVAGNINATAPDLFSRGLVTLSWSAVGSRDGFAATGAGNVPFGANLVLGPLADNGGPTRTLRPLRGSPLINSGANPAGLAHDQRGRDFPRQLGPAADIGAVETTTLTPTATAAAPNVTQPGGNPFAFTVTYDAPAGIDTATLGAGDVTVTGPAGFIAVPALVDIDVGGDGTPRVATYALTPPGGQWDAADVGDYTITVNAGEVAAVDGRPVPERPAGGFSVVLPRVLTVTNTNDAGPGSLRQAIADANAVRAGVPDTITFDPAVFSAFQRITIEDELVITDAVTIAGPGPNLLSINGNAATRLMYLDGIAEDAVDLVGIRFENGRAFGDGGGILNRNLALSLRDCWLVNCAAVSGAGGGIAVVDAAGSLTLTDCRLTLNVARGFGLTGDGGAVYVAGASHVFIERTTLADNFADDDGGGIAAAGGGMLTLIASTLSGNRAGAGRGGAVFFAGVGAVAVRNSTVSGNTAGTLGGGVAVAGGSDVAVENATLTANAVTAPGGRGGGIGVGTEAALLAATSAVIAGNTASEAADLAAPPTRVAVLQNAFVSRLAPGDAAVRGSGNQIGTLAEPLDPELLPLGNNGGPTWTHGLGPTSPLRDAGANPAGLAHDQRGPGFPRVSGSAADVGAFEASAPAAPPTATVVVNDGTPQRSRVYALVVRFSADASFPAGVPAALRFERIGPGGPTGLVPTAAVVAGQQATILFTPSAMAPTAGSLIDGEYRLTIFAALVQGPGGALDGNGDGAGGDDLVLNTHRLFGDADGDRDVDAADWLAFRAAFGGQTFTFDADFDGDTDAADFAAFRAAFGSSLP